MARLAGLKRVGSCVSGVTLFKLYGCGSSHRVCSGNVAGRERETALDGDVCGMI